MDDQPYVRYLVEAEVPDKGLSFAIKKTLVNFLAGHNLAGKVEEFTPTGNRASMMVSIYATQTDDMVVQEMYNALDCKGRMARNNSWQPKITITPVPYDVKVEKPASGDLAWQKTMEDLTARLRGTERNASQLQEMLADSERRLTEAESVNAKLQYEVKNLIPKEYDNPLEALVETFLPKGIPLMRELSPDLLLLHEAGDVKMLAYVCCVKGPMDYISLKLWPEPAKQEEGTPPIPILHIFPDHFPATKRITMEELERLEDFAQYDSWEESPAGIRLLERKRRYEANQKVLEFAKAEGADDEVIGAAAKANEGVDVAALSEDIVVYQREFEQKLDLAEKLPALVKGCLLYKEVQDNVFRRLAERRCLPIIQYESKEEFSIYLPEADAVLLNCLEERTGMRLQSRQGKNYLSIKLAEVEESFEPATVKIGGEVKHFNKSVYTYFDPLTNEETNPHFAILVLTTLLLSLGVGTNIARLEIEKRLVSEHKQPESLPGTSA